MHPTHHQHGLLPTGSANSNQWVSGSGSQVLTSGCREHSETAQLQSSLERDAPWIGKPSRFGIDTCLSEAYTNAAARLASLGKEGRHGP
jgi:hypothetical protein